MGQKREFSTFFASNSIAFFAFIASYAAFASFAGAFLEKDPGRGKKGSVFSAKKAKVAKKAIAFLTFGFALLD